MLRKILTRPFCYALLVLFLLGSQQVIARSLPEFARLVEENGPAVVNITTTRTVAPQKMIPERYLSPENEELFDELIKHPV